MMIESQKNDITTAPRHCGKPMLGAVPSRKDAVLEYFKKKSPDYRFIWRKTEKWVAVYETVGTLCQKTGIPKSTIYKALSQLRGTEGFSFSYGLIHYEYRVA